MGWKQRLALGCAVLHEPRIVFLDEPTGGVDPASRRRFWELDQRSPERGITVFVTTHYLDEAEYCNDIRLIHAGRIVAGGSPQELKTKYIHNPILEVSSDRIVEAMELLQKESWVLETSIFGTYLHVSVADEEEGRRLVRERLEREGIAIYRIDRIMPSLEDVFIHKIEEQDRISGAGGGEAMKLRALCCLRSGHQEGVPPDQPGLPVADVLDLPPGFMLVMFGFALNFDVKHIPLAVVDQDGSRASRDLVDKFRTPNISISRAVRQRRPPSTRSWPGRISGPPWSSR